MKTLNTTLLLGLTALVCSCAVQPYHAEINTFDGLIRVNSKDVRECEAYAKVNARGEYTLERDLALGAASGFLLGAWASSDRTASLLIGTITGSNIAVRSIEDQTVFYTRECLKSRGYIVTN
jgi:hypothetical protein